MSGEEQVLKRGKSRGVRVEARASGTVVVKRFERPGLLPRPWLEARDARRARREFALLEHLRSAGVPVPRPLALRREQGAHVLELEWIAGARPLSELLSAGARPPVRLARELGGLLAGLQLAGVVHGDLHAGNALVDPTGRVFAIDFGRARRVRSFSRARLRADLVEACAALRESTPAHWRASAFRAWRRELEARAGSFAHGARLLAAAADVEPLAVEGRARTARRALVKSRERRFLARGTAVLALARPRALVRKDLAEGLREAALAAAVGADDASKLGARGASLGARLHCSRGSEREVLFRWRSMARLEEHGIAAPRCAVLLRQGAPAAVFLRPTPASSSPARAAGPRERGAFLGALLDRGLWLEGLRAEHLGSEGLREALAVLEIDAARGREHLDAWIEAAEPANAGARAAFRAGFLSAWRGAPAEARALLLRV